MLVILANCKKLGATGRKLEAVDSAAMKTSQLSKHLLVIDLPNEHVNHLRFTSRSHLTCGCDLATRVYGKCHHIILMQVEEFLFAAGFILHHTKGSSRVYDPTSSLGMLFRILQVSTSVVASESMSVLETKVTIRSLGGVPRGLVSCRGTRLHLSEEGLHSQCLVSCVLFLLSAENEVIRIIIIGSQATSSCIEVFVCRLISVEAILPLENA